MRAIGLMLAILVLNAPAEAAVPGEADLLICATKPDAADRLACYDRAVAGLSAEAQRLSVKRDADAKAFAAAEAAASAKLATEAAAKMEADKLAAFGADSIRAADRPARVAENLSQIDAKVAETFAAFGDKLVFSLDNGQMWRQIDGMPLPPVRAGHEVMVKKALLGAYKLTIIRIGRTVGVVRIR